MCGQQHAFALILHFRKSTHYCLNYLYNSERFLDTYLWLILTILSRNEEKCSVQTNDMIGVKKNVIGHEKKKVSMTRKCHNCIAQTYS